MMTFKATDPAWGTPEYYRDRYAAATASLEQDRSTTAYAGYAGTLQALLEGTIARLEEIYSRNERAPGFSGRI